MKLKLLSFCLYLLWGSSYADERQFEVSFGTSQMLVDEIDRRDLKNKSKVVLPTTGALFIAEYLWSESWGSLFVLNLPLVTQKFVVNGELIEEAAATTYMIGQRYSPYQWNITNTAVLAPQIALLISAIQGDKWQISPSVAGRLHVYKETGFSMYLGSTVTYGIKGYVLFYGIGQKF